ncbi:ubiquitin conjugating enzyme E2 B-like [Schistocerca gregaria]|uniref:ubiquitin conjugating enzyme E2 B-like n=1 Tax=Schistocerca gregaria TaxID=7010 RepID=UPI00211EECB4|nr:ubiquitin conjugating enzyme E2 B-like [Schistocerca gregaria]
MSNKAPALSRLQKEFKEFTNKPLEWATMKVVDDNLHHWRVTIEGPEKTPYESGFFTIDLEMPAEYPFKPPKVKFITKVYHPNILKKDGSICAEVLGSTWSPQIKLHEVLLILRSMLAEPNVDSPLEEEIAEQFQNNRDTYNKTAKYWTKKYAKKEK